MLGTKGLCGRRGKFLLEVKNIVKKFGDLTAIDDISFVAPKGAILGLIGQNGAGKTTTFRLILNFLEQDQGEILWCGKKIDENLYNDIGYLPEERGLYPKETIEKQLIFFAKLRGKTKQEILPKIDYWLEKFQVKGKKTDKVKILSKGNQQKVQLIATLIHEPKLVILDEPFSGLDPVNVELLENAILEFRNKGACIIFSSHNMDNVEKIVDNLFMLKDGKAVLNGKLRNIRESFGRNKLFIESDLTFDELNEIEGITQIKKTAGRCFELRLANPSIGKIIFEKATKNGYIPVFNQVAPTLDEIFKWKVSAESV